ncbi:MAG: phosphate ABC transporter permease PstA [Kineosporiaceae bacterium]
MAVLSTPRDVVRSTGLRGSARSAAAERAVSTGLFIAIVITVGALVILVTDFAVNGVPRLSWDFIVSYPSRFADSTGIRNGITGTISLMVLTALFTFPVSVGAAIYLEEFAAKNRWNQLLETNITNLAGVPSVIYGLLGLSVFVYFLGFGRSLLAGALTLSLLAMPVVIVATREALRSVPQEIRAGALALGATPVQTAFRQTFPAALPGTLTGTILALSRAIGETAPILVVGAVFSRRTDNEPWSLLESFSAIPVLIFDFVKRPQAEFQNEVAAAAIVVLMGLLLIMNSVAIVIRYRYTKKL